MNDKDLKDRVSEEARRIISARAADAVEVVVNNAHASTVRFASSTFHQGGSSVDSTVYIRVISGRKVGVASVNSLERDALKGCLKRAVEIAERVKEEPFAVALPGRQAYPEIDSYFETTTAMTFDEKASMLSKGFKRAGALGVLASGSLTTDTGSLFVFNSNGVEASHQYTSAHLSVVSTKEGQSGIKIELSKDISKIDIPSTMIESARRCLAAQSPREISPGAYRVLLDPPAVAELLYWLSYTGFGAKNFHEGTSFLSGKLGERVTGPMVTIYDDGTDPRGLCMPFDMEGVAKKRLPIIEKGVARGIAYDSFTASAEGVVSTGNAPFPEETEGPMPDHIFMEPGRESTEELLERLGTGIVVRSFHYVNGLLNPAESLMTGMTRHGAFFVEDGRIRYPVSPMRFTENIMKAFERIVGVSLATELLPNHGFPLSSISAPHILIDGFNFTS
jgi:PmbA protein